MLQGNLLTLGAPAVASAPTIDRIELDVGSWIDVARGFLIGADEVMTTVIDAVEWRTGRRQMYDREVDDPRLSRWWRDPADVPHPVLGDVRAAIGDHYAVEFGGVGLNYYRDGADSVAFHRDRELRDPATTLVAIVTLGSQRPFRIRPFGGGPSIDVSPASGDLLVMGGRCQTDWEHGVPKVSRGIGPRVSASWRWSPDGSHRRTQRDGYFTSRQWRASGTPPPEASAIPESGERGVVHPFG